MNPEEKRKKLLPHSAKKQQLRLLYWHIPDLNLTNNFHHVARENNPHIPDAKNIRRHSLNFKEMKHLVSIIGPPKGYSE